MANVMQFFGKILPIWGIIKRLFLRLDRIEIALNESGAVDFVKDEIDEIRDDILKSDKKVDPDDITGDAREQLKQKVREELDEQRDANVAAEIGLNS